MDIGRSIKEGLRRNGENQRWLSKQMGWLEQHTSAVVNNKRSVSLPVIVRLAGVFRVSSSEFIKWGEE